MKLLTSRQIRQVRDVCIFRINGMEVFCNFVKINSNYHEEYYFNATSNYTNFL